MYNATTIKAQLSGLVGWRQNADAAGWQLTALTTSSSGLWFNGVHPMLSFDNLVSIAPRFQDIDPTQSAINTKFTAWLTQKTEDGIVKVVEDWLSDKLELLTAGALLENDDAFKATGNLAALQAKAGKLVGLEIIPVRSKNVINAITRIGIQFNTNQTVRVYLFKSGQVVEVSHQDIVYTGAGAVQWQTVSWELAGEGAYYIAYDEDAITGQAINGVYDFNYLSAGSLTAPSNRFAKVTAFAADTTPAALWDLTGNQYSLDTNYGLNLTSSVRCDYTDFIAKQKEFFKTAVALRVGIDILREIAFNPESRVNRNVENVTRGQILYEIDGDSQGRNDFSLMSQYKKALSSIRFDTTGIDPVCLPCRRRGVRFATIGP